MFNIFIFKNMILISFFLEIEKKSVTMVIIDIAPFEKVDHLMSAVYIITKYKHYELKKITMLINSVLGSSYSVLDIDNFITLLSLYPNNYGVKFFSSDIQNKINTILKSQTEIKLFVFITKVVKCINCFGLLNDGKCIKLKSIRCCN